MVAGLAWLRRMFEGTWCAWCGGYVTHNPFDAHRAQLLDQRPAATIQPSQAQPRIVPGTVAEPVGVR